MDFKTGLKIFPLLVLAAGSLEAFTNVSGPIVSVSTYSVEASTLSASTYTWRTVRNTAFAAHEDLTFVVKWGLVTAGFSTFAPIHPRIW